MCFQVQEFTLDYTYCKSLNNPSQSCADIIENNRNMSCNCSISFNLNDDFIVSYNLNYSTVQL